MSSFHSPVHPKVQWDCFKRQVLCCLYRFFHLNEEAFEKVFSEIFRRDLLERGFGNRGPSYRVLYAQWTWLKRTHSPIWLHVHRDTEFRLDTDWGPLLNRIQKAASKIGSGLVLKDEDDIDLTKLENVDVSERLGEYLESVLLSNHTSTGVPSVIATQSLPTTQSLPAQDDTIHDCVKASSSDCLVTSHGKVCLWCQEDGEPVPQDLGYVHQSEGRLAPLSSAEDIPGFCAPEDLPPTLCRWSNFSSQGVNSRHVFLAGMFAPTGSELFDPRQLLEEDLLNFFKSHVRKEKVPTPFISTFTLPLAPIHRALHSPEGAIISVIDTGKLDTPVFKAQSLVPITGTATRSWKGFGEFLIWGRIPTQAIACTFTVASLKEVAADDDSINRFLQLERILSHRRCSRQLHNELRGHLGSNSEYDRPLRRLVNDLGVPVASQDVVVGHFKEAWTKEIRDIEDRPPEGSLGHYHEFGDPSQRQISSHLVQRLVSASDSSDFVPPAPTNDGSRDTSDGEYVRGSDESSDAPLPRQDTPDDFHYTVVDDSTICSGRQRKLAPITPPRSGLQDWTWEWVMSTPTQSLPGFGHEHPGEEQDTEDEDMEDEWPSDDDEGWMDDRTNSRGTLPSFRDAVARREFFKRFEM